MNIKFAQLISYITAIRYNSNCALQEHEIQDISDMVKDCTAPAKIVEGELNNLMGLMNGGCLKIEAIKSYRTLTGASLLDAKNAVEKYWVSKPVANAS